MTESYYRTDTGQSGKDECLSDLQIAALLDNSLKPMEKQALFKHLNRCADCRFCWMEASISITNATTTQDRVSWRERLRKLVSIDFIPPKLSTAVTVITAVLVCAVLIFPLQKSIEPLLDEQYALLTTQKHSIQTKLAMKNMPLPWEHASFSFAPAQIDASALAFAAGLLDGRNTLSYDTDESLPGLLTAKQNSAWNANEQGLYYQLGRWMTSLWFVNQLDNNRVEWWNKQSIIMERFNSAFRSKNISDRQAAKTLKALQRINTALIEIQQVEIQQAPHAQDDFRRQVEMVIIQLSPDSLGE